MVDQDVLVAFSHVIDPDMVLQAWDEVAGKNFAESLRIVLVVQVAWAYGLCWRRLCHY